MSKMKKTGYFCRTMRANSLLLVGEEHQRGQDGAIAGGISEFSSQISKYIEKSNTQTAKAEKYLEIDRNDYRDAFWKDLNYWENPDGNKSYYYIQENIYFETENQLAERLKSLDPVQHLKIGNMHIRNYSGNDPRIPQGLSVHYDKFDVVLHPILHYLFDTIYQDKIWGRR